MIKEKAIKLVDKMWNKMYSDGYYDAVQCAIIAQELVIKKLKEHSVVSEKENLILQNLKTII